MSLVSVMNIVRRQTTASRNMHNPSLPISRGISLSRCLRAESSTSGSNPFPYPHNSSPTPHEIFHLHRSASAAEIKSRYYELARIYHPDSTISHLESPKLRQIQWNAISNAYDALRGKSFGMSSSRSGGTPSGGFKYPRSSYSPSGRRYSGRRTPWGFEYDGHLRPHPDGLTEPFWLSRNNIMLALVAAVSLSILLTRTMIISPTMSGMYHHLDAVDNLEEARRAGRSHGERRRQELRQWIEEGGMRGMGSSIGRGSSRRARPPDGILDVEAVQEIKGRSDS